MLRVLAVVGDDMVVGTHNGNVGVILRCIMQDEGIVESKEIDRVEAEPHRDVYRMLYVPPTPVDFFTRYTPEMSAKFEIENIKLNLWRYGDFQLRVGYSPKTKTWVVSKAHQR